MAKKLKDEAVPTQQAADEALIASRGGLVVYSDFELKYKEDGVAIRKEYKAGDAFKTPKGWTRDESYEALIINKQKKREGIVFVVGGDRMVLPVREG